MLSSTVVPAASWCVLCVIVCSLLSVIHQLVLYCHSMVKVRYCCVYEC